MWEAENGMSNYDVHIKRLLKESNTGNVKTEIWAEITNKDTHETIKKLIWWEDDEGIYHDETSDLPVELRGLVDNAWIEKSRKW